ncbi:hypothetical protein [Achromobacter aegrifaciens]|jgi:hypothetical protein|uniref:hypothetical protein n=1 Tax=Achromobacter aegrifaciens TaxID=1287736 RepID=UPI0014679D30|nr:hypothetical protein [Achromobacter aegrifaciens]CAB3629180.1 hypothetical protein LMG26852_00880 [Achromobacter aegrifaciens]CAB3812522.1 hypothetical protein LMG26854_00420 [Achromobacter aegrifaciens]
MEVLILSSLASLFLGSFCIYRASPNQRWGATSWPVLPARVAGILLLALGGWGCLRAFSAVAAVFVFCTALMLFFSLMPYLGVLAGLRGSDTHEAR